MAPVENSDSVEQMEQGYQEFAPAGSETMPQPSECIPANMPVEKLLECQGKVLRQISQKSSPRKTLIPVFDLAEELLECTAIGVEVVSHRSELLHHLNFRNVPATLVKPAERRPARDRMSIGAHAITDKQPILIDGSNTSGQIPEPIADGLAKAGYNAVYSLPLFGETRDEPIGALSLYFAGQYPQGDGVKKIVAFLVELAEHAALHRHSREAKKVADDRFSVLVDSVPGVVYQRVVTPDGQIRYTYISDSAEELFGVPAEEIINNPDALFKTHGEGYREGFHDRLIEASRTLTMWDVEATIVSTTGEKKHTHAIARPVKQADGTVVWNGIILDTTRIKNAEKAAAIAERRTRAAIVESLNQGFVLFDSDDKLVISNSRLESYYPALAQYLKPGTALEDFLVAESQLGLLGDDEFDSEEGGGAIDFDPKTGLSPAIERHLENDIWLLVQAYCPDGKETVILYTDVSEIKDRQLALERSNRELQDFASVASHDLQEPLRKIEAFGGRLKSRCADDLNEQGQFYLERMQSAAVRMRTLINDLLSYSRVTSQARPFAVCDMNQIVGDVLGDLQLRIEDNQARVNKGELAQIDADPLQMRQLMQNIIGNALKYRREGLEQVVEIAGRIVPRDRGDMLEISVSDNGIGFNMRYAEKIFNVFQRLHGQAEYPGTGIGLATCRKIVERHNGEIRTESIEGEGSVFRIYLPIKQNLKNEA